MSHDDPFPARHARTVALPVQQRTPPPPWAQVVRPMRTVPMSGLAACSFTLGLLAFVTFGAFGIPAIITGTKAQRWTADGTRGGHGLACVGVLLGWLSIAGWIVLWVVLAVGVLGSLGGDQ